MTDTKSASRERQCKRCETPFTCTNNRQLFCCAHCRKRAFDARYPGKDRDRKKTSRLIKINQRTPAECRACGGLFIPGLRKYYCSSSCRVFYGNTVQHPQYYQRNKAKFSAFMKKWNEKNPDKKREMNRKAKARMRRQRRLGRAADRVNKILLVIPIIQENADE